MHFLLALLLATRIGGMGLTVLPPDGWSVVAPDEMPTPPPYNRVVVLRKGTATVQVARTPIPPELKQKSPAELLNVVWAGGKPASTTIAGMPAARKGRLAVAIRGEYLYTFLSSGEEPAAFDAILKSAELNDDPIRIEAKGLSMELPDGWRQMETAELDAFRAVLKPQNELQQKIADARDKFAGPPLIMKHDPAAGRMIASVQADRKPIPKGAFSPVEIARTLCAAARASLRATIEVEPHEITVDGLPAAEFIQRYTLVETNGSHDMRAHTVLIARKDDCYLIAYVGPAEDAEDAKVFRDVVLKSVTIAK